MHPLGFLADALFMHPVLYISYDGMTDPLGQSQVIPYLIELSKNDLEFHIISAEKPSNFQTNKAQISALLKANNIHWHPVQYTKKPPLISTMKDIRAMKRLAITLHKTYQFKATHCRSYISAFVGMTLKKKFQVPFLFDMRGFYADERVDGGLWNQSNPVYRQVYKFFKRKEKIFMNSCDQLISLTENGKQCIASWEFEHLKTDDITVIPCCADLDHFNPEKVDSTQRRELQSSLNISDKDFVLSYLGSIGTWYLPEEMLDFFAVLLKNRPESKFLILTRDDTENMREMARKKSIPEDKLIFRPASRNEVPALISLSDVSIFFIKPVFSKKASSPTKLAELLGMGVPVICNGNVGDIDNIIETYQAGLVIREFNTATYQTIADRLPEILQINSQHLRSVADEHFSLTVGTKSYLKAYNNLIEK